MASLTLRNIPDKLMKALADAYFWMVDPANFPTVITTVREVPGALDLTRISLPEWASGQPERV